MKTDNAKKDRKTTKGNVAQHQAQILDDCICALQVKAHSGEIVDYVNDERFFKGEYSADELKKIGGTHFLYKVVAALYERVLHDTEHTASQIQWRTADMEKNKDLALLWLARLQGMNVVIDNECMEVLKQLDKDEQYLELYDKDGNPNEVAFTRLRHLEEAAKRKLIALRGGIYSRVKRRRAEVEKQGGAAEVKRFTDMLDLQLKCKQDEEDTRKEQLQRCANWLKAEKADGRTYSFERAVLEYKDQMKAETERGGYPVDGIALAQELRRIAKDEKQGKPNKYGICGIGEFLKNGRGRPSENGKGAKQ